ncbi:MAG: hypothetical protein U1E59_03730 [Amaricoccus sp.]
MRRAVLILALAPSLPPAGAFAQGPYPSPASGVASGPALHRSGAAPSVNGATEATVAPARHARSGCAIGDTRAACTAAPEMSAGN